MTPWGPAISEWLEGRPAAVVELVQALDVPEFAREFLGDLARGTVHREPGRPTERDGWVERSIVTAAFREWEHSSKEAACAAVAERRGIKTDAVRGLVDKLRDLGITQERWQSWGRPDL